MKEVEYTQIIFLSLEDREVVFERLSVQIKIVMKRKNTDKKNMKINRKTAWNIYVMKYNINIVNNSR